MKNKEELLKEFAALLPFVESLRELEDEIWRSPIEEGKWTIRDVIAHIMLWDQYFFEEGIQKINSHQPLTVKHLDFNEFNRNAVEYAKGKNKQEIIDQTVYYRNELLRHLDSIPEEDYTKEHLDGDGQPFSAYHYLIGFIPHDTHHMNQLKPLVTGTTRNLSK